MAKSHMTSLSPLSIWIGRALSNMIPVSEDIWRQLFLKVGIVTQGSWIIQNSKQVRQRMTTMEKQGLVPEHEGQQTYDFSTMYPSMKLEEVNRKMAQYIHLVFEYQKQSAKGSSQVLVLKQKGKCFWTKRKKEQADDHRTKYVTAQRLIKWIKYLLKRLFVKVGDKIMLQKIGLPKLLTFPRKSGTLHV